MPIFFSFLILFFLVLIPVRGTPNEDLLQAARKGNAETVKTLLKAGAESIIVQQVNIDFSRVEVDYTVSERESDYFKENKFKEDRIRRLKEYQAYQKLLWNVFANKPHESLFDPITTESWYAKWSYYLEKLIEKAEQAGFSGKLLKKCIGKIEPDPGDKTTLLPIGAYYAKHGEDNVWIIICKWEYAQEYNSAYHLIDEILL